MASGAFDSGHEAALERCEVIRELGARTHSVYVARHSAAGGKPRLVILERFPGAAKPGDETSATFVREAKRIAALLNPNITRMREVITHGEDVLVLSDYLDGERLAEMWTLDEHHPPIEISLRILFDVLAGSGVLHDLKDSKQQPMKLVHGELSPVNILVGLDGTARVMFSAARRAPRAASATESTGYLAPSEETTDLRADVFSAGVLLWEALSGRALFPASEGPVTAERARSTSPPTVPEKASWSRPLVDIAAKALAPVASDRFPSAAAMLTEMRKAVGVKVASSSSVAAYVKAAYGERIQARRVALEGAANPVVAVSGTRTAAAPKVEPSGPKLEPSAPKLEPSTPKLEPSTPKLEPSAPRLAVAPPRPAEDAPPPQVPNVAAAPSSQPELPLPELPKMPAIIPTLVPGRAAPPPRPKSESVEELDEAELVSSDSIPPLDRAERDSDRPTAIVEVPGLRRASGTPAKMQAADEPAPQLPAAVAPPASPVPSPVVEVDAETMSESPGNEVATRGEQLRRRRMFILGGVGAVGVIMLILTAWRLTHDTAAPPDLSALPAASDTGTVTMKSLRTVAPPTPPSTPPARTVESSAPATDTSPPIVTPPPVVAKPKPPPPAAVAAPTPTKRPTPAAATPPPKPKTPTHSSRPKTFDPSSL